jgi:hypothetical protein
VVLNAIEMAETQEEAQELLDELAAIGDDLDNKAEQYIRIIKVKEAEAEGFKAEADRLTKKRKAAENVTERLKTAMLDVMKVTGRTEIPTSIGKWKIQTNPMSCDVTDPDKVPQRFHVPQPDKIDKAAMIREHKATGEIFDGAEFKQEQGIRFR